MRILLDESLPRRLRSIVAGHDVATVVEAGWSRVENGELLQLAATRFDVFVTADQNLQYQQNLSALPVTVAVFVALDNRLESLRPTATELLARLGSLPTRSFCVAVANHSLNRTARLRRWRAVRSRPVSLVR